MSEIPKINYGHGTEGKLFEEEVADYLDKHKIKFFREHKIEGKGKTWRVDFYIPSLNAILFCKKTNPKATLNKHYFLSDLCKIIDLLNTEKYNSIFLFNDYTTSLKNVLLCTAYGIYLLYSINGLFILTEETFGSHDHVKEINELYIKLRSSEKLAFEAFIRRKKMYKIIQKYPQTISSLQDELSISEHQVKRDIEYLTNEELVFTRRYGGQGGPSHFFARPNKDLYDFMEIRPIIEFTHEVHVADLEEQLRLVQEYIRKKG